MARRNISLIDIPFYFLACIYVSKKGNATSFSGEGRHIDQGKNITETQGLFNGLTGVKTSLK